MYCFSNIMFHIINLFDYYQQQGNNKKIQMQRLQIQIIALFIFTALSNCKLGVLLISDYTYPQAVIKCAAGSGYVNAMQITGLDGQIQQNINQQLYKIKNTGMIVDLLYAPCFGKDPRQEMSSFMKKVEPTLIDRVWIILLQQQTQICTWASDNPAKNINILSQYLSLFKQNNFKVGLFTNKSEWESKTNGTSQFKNFPLVWAPETDDYNPSFDNYVPFSGWEKPTAKLLVQKIICGAHFITYYEA